MWKHKMIWDDKLNSLVQFKSQRWKFEDLLNNFVLNVEPGLFSQFNYDDFCYGFSNFSNNLAWKFANENWWKPYKYYENGQFIVMYK